MDNENRPNDEHQENPAEVPAPDSAELSVDPAREGRAAPPEEATGFTFGAQIAGAIAFLLLMLLATVVFLELFAPKQHEPEELGYTDYDSTAMQEAIAPEAVRAHLDKILAFGSRWHGQPGLAQTQNYIRQRFDAAGLEVFEYEADSPYPVTRYAEVLSPGGEKLPVDIYPFMPNHVQPMLTPEEGVTGELIVLNDQVLQTRPSFRDCIGLLNNAEKAPEGYGYDWVKYGQLGMKAIIVAHPEGLEGILWKNMTTMVSANPVNYVRLAAGPDIFKYVGQDITLRVNVRYENVAARTLVGLLETGNGDAKEAVVVLSDADAASLIPDRSPGNVEAVALATQMSLLDGIQHYRKNLKRDVLFVNFESSVLAQQGLNDFLRIIGPLLDRPTHRADLVARQEQNDARRKQVEEVLELLEQPEFMSDRDSTLELLDRIEPDTRTFFEDQYRYVLNTYVFELAEGMLTAKIAFEKEVRKVEKLSAEETHIAERIAAGPPETRQSLQRHLEGVKNALEIAGKIYDEKFAIYRDAKEKYDRAFSSAGYSVGKLLLDKQDFVKEYEVREHIQTRFNELAEHHAQQTERLARALKLHDLMARYSRVTFLTPQLMPYEQAPGQETLSFSMGADVAHADEAQVMKNLADRAIQRLNIGKKIKFEYQSRNHARYINSQTNGIPLHAGLCSYYSYPSYDFVSTHGSYKEFARPVPVAHARNLNTIKHSLQIVGETLLSMAFGNGQLKPMKKVQNYPDYYGNVFVSNVGQSIIPNYPKKHALLACKGWDTSRGWFPYLMWFTDVYGQYDQHNCAAPFTPNPWDFSPDALSYDRQGRITYMKDQGTAAQSVYKSMNLNPHQIDTAINIVLFRAAPVSLLDLTNPQTLKSYSAMELINSRSLSPFASKNMFRHGGLFTAFVKPGEYFYVELKAGDVDNELVQTTRAFMLGIDKEEVYVEDEAGEPRPVRLGKEIRGDGYLAAESPIILNVPQEIAKSMLYVNSQRLQLQQKHHMASGQTEKFHDRSKELLRDAFDEDAPKDRRRLLARDAVTYATLNHPVLRQKIFEAVAGILWYLGLLVPFVFFFEKLVFGFTDIRKQLFAQLIIFLVIFGLLKLLHPAFEMIRSSLMILLGFIIFLFSAGIAVLFSGKFRENLEQIKQRRGQVTAAEVNTMGVIATSFMLGLNNMHRRRVRTGLTCGTLVLLTFVMICFTSVRRDFIEEQNAFGKAPYQGFLVKNEKFVPITPQELFALQTKYARKYEYLPTSLQTPSKQDHVVLPRYMYVGTEDWSTRERHNAEVSIVHETDGAQLHDYEFDSIMRLSYREPLVAQIELLTDKGWFTKEQEQAETGMVPLIIPKTAAEKLRITPEMVNEGDVVVRLAGEQFLIHGIFNGQSLNRAEGLDGKSVLPFDVKGMMNLRRQGRSTILADEMDPKIDGEKIILAPQRNLNINIEKANEIIHSVAVVLPADLNYKQARGIIYNYLEQSQKYAYYGLDGYAFLGRRARASSLSGLMELMIPLIIAALTVLNTMKGSVYERKDEIFVYNAVGIAPRYIFAMFFAEAFVYAVVGSVLGYILSQGTGRVLTILDWTGGLNMTFTSKTTIYASLAIAGSVFASTYFPAKSAMQIAAPTEDVGWQLPEPEGDQLEFSLPFTFDYRDRVAVLCFFNRYFVDHGEGSSGAFFAGSPQMGLRETLDPLDNDAYVPQISVTIWLKPYDLGVCQQLTIALPTDPETGEYIANLTLTRRSGSLENWKRLNRRFISLIRKHFLYWRAVSESERQQMFAEAKEMLEEKVLS